jgi:hypothetical protein
MYKIITLSPGFIHAPLNAAETLFRGQEILNAKMFATSNRGNELMALKSLRDPFPGLPDFSPYKIPKRGKLYQMTTKYTKWSQNISNNSKIDQMVIK